jgi:hypothetical protein
LHEPLPLSGLQRQHGKRLLVEIKGDAHG